MTSSWRSGIKYCSRCRVQGSLFGDVIHLCPLREGNMSTRIFVGVLAGVIFRISQDFFGPLSLLLGLGGGVAALLTVLLCWVAGIGLLRRQL